MEYSKIRLFTLLGSTRTKEDAFNNPDAIELLKAVEQVPQRTTEQTTADDVMTERNVWVREDNVETMHQERRGGVEQEEQQVEISTTHRPRKRRKKKLCDIPGCREKFADTCPIQYSGRCFLLEEEGHVFPKLTWAPHTRKCANPSCTNKDSCKASNNRSRCLSARQVNPWHQLIQHIIYHFLILEYCNQTSYFPL